ncbi:unnamed protein product [Amoebophrya sp. A120]|nr:unnamed protein product [Amoebophrya sp. A120]|eukprot:GSA120T00006930001.1
MKLHLSRLSGKEGEMEILLKEPVHRRKKGRPVYFVHDVAVLHYFAFVIMVLFTGPSSPGAGGEPHYGVLVDNLFAAEALRISASRPAKGHQRKRTKSASLSFVAPSSASRSRNGPASPVSTKTSFTTEDGSGGSGGRGNGGRTRTAGSWNEDKPRAGASFAQESEEQLRVGHGNGIKSKDCIASWLPSRWDVQNRCSQGASWVGQVYVVTKNPDPGGTPCEAWHGFKRKVVCPRDCVGSWNYATEQALIDSCNGQGGEKSRKFTITTSVGGTWQKGKRCRGPSRVPGIAKNNG